MIYTKTNPERVTPTCLSCGKPMQFIRTVPGIGGLPELRVYSCRQCGISFTEADEPAQLASRC